MDIRRCSLNSATVRGRDLGQVVDDAVTSGLSGVGLWRDVVEEMGAEAAGRRVAEAGLRVTSLCRGGMFTSATAVGRRHAWGDNRTAVDDAYATGAECLVLVCGGMRDVGFDVARGQIAEGVARLAAYAYEAGVPLAVEPMHPMMAADRSAITSLTEALELIDAIGADNVGVAVDAYHLWWDERMHTEISRAGSRILSAQISDWVTPIAGELSSRGMPGEGVIDLAGFLWDLDTAGYAGLVEVEVLSDRWARVPEEALAAAVAGIRSI
jgi:sugar phosphate isomerase/epimerase